MKWEELSKRIDEIEIGKGVPKIRGEDGPRPITKKVGSRIYMRTGVKTRGEKYITKEMLRYAYETIQFGGTFTSAGLKSNFPRECGQGPCVFSMNGGILVLLKQAEYIQGVGYMLVDEK